MATKKVFGTISLNLERFEMGANTILLKGTNFMYQTPTGNIVMVTDCKLKDIRKIPLKAKFIMFTP